MTQLEFTKMHGLGNDFILVEEKKLPSNVNYEQLSKKLCDRHFGIGGDGLIVVRSRNAVKEADTAWRIFNADGTEPEMCGNGIRCFAKYVYDRNLIDKAKFTVSTLAGLITPVVEESGMITVDMGEPVLTPAEIPVNIAGDRIIDYPLNVLDKTFRINCVSMGNPHCIIFVDEPVDAVKYGTAIENHSVFPRRTNVEFVQVLSKSHIKVNVWERGCGITLACGTGACACVVAAVINKLTARKIKVTLPGGELFINYDRDSGRLYMTGPAEYAFEGSLYL